MTTLFTNVLGTFALKEGKVTEKILFKGATKEIAEKLLKIEQGSFCEEEKELIKKSGEKEIEVKDPRRFSDFPGEVKFKKFEGKLPAVLEIGLQVGMKERELMELNRQVALELSKLKLKIPRRDRVLIQSINALDELEEVINLLMEHLRELYSLSFPELVELRKEPKSYVEAILDKEDKEITIAKKKSIGMEFSAQDEKAAQELAKGISGLHSTLDNLEKSIEITARGVAPSTTALIGPLLTARLISLAGSLKKLALMPSSTIQILGAEKAFFRFLKSKKRPPKHGIIFQYPEIRSAKNKIRGKLSRTLASKIAIAARTDFHQGNFIGDKLKEDFLKRVKSLKK